MKEKAGIIAGTLTFLGFSALCVWHHAGISDSHLSTISPATASPSATSHTHPPDSPAVVPTATVVKSPLVVVPVPTAETGSSLPQTQPEPPTQEHPRQQTLMPSLRGKVIEFFTDSDVLTPKGREALETLLPGLHNQPMQQVEIAGHTDNLGREDYNRNLSQRRAETVKRYFIMQGLAEEHVIARGYGSSLPIADNATAAGRQRNRRTEIIFHRTVSGS